MGKLANVDGDFPAVLQRNTFIDTLEAPPALQQARALRRNRTDGDLPQVRHRLQSESATTASSASASGSAATPSSVLPANSAAAADVPMPARGGELATGVQWQNAPAAAEAEVNDATVPTTAGSSTSGRVGDAEHTGVASLVSRNTAAAREICCPLCERYRTTGAARNFVVHLVRSHPGESLGNALCETLGQLDRGVCASAGCGALRLRTSATCKHCGKREAVRRADPSDRIPGELPPAVDDPLSGVPNPSRPETLPHAVSSVIGAAPDLPVGWLERVRALPPHTRRYIPASLRPRFIDIDVRTLSGAIDGVASWSALAEAWPKLLLAPVEENLQPAAVIRKRLDLWDAREWLQLIEMAEAAYERPSTDASDSSRSRRQRARRLVKAGAFRKAVQGLSSVSFECSLADESKWASSLLPKAGRVLRPPVSRTDAQAEAGQGGVEDVVEVAEEGTIPKPLEGVHFAAESAPGPSGRRPEHLRDLLACPRRRATRRLLALLSRLQSEAASGRLPQCMNWLLRTRVVYIGKKGSSKPRPLRVGEFLRRVISKRELFKQRPQIMRRMLAARQFGIALPGGAECLIHWRAAIIEEIKANPACGVWAIVDLDWANCYPSLEWDDVEDSIDKWVPALGPWTRWCHGVVTSDQGIHAELGAVRRLPQPAILPSGAEHLADRGAEQGDPLGGIQCGAVLSDVADEAATARASVRGASPVFDVWYADDSQAVCRPEMVHSFLETMDAAAARRGAYRSSGADCKSRVQLVGHQDALASFDGTESTWQTAYVKATCNIDAPNSPSMCLGSVVGDAEAKEHQFENKVAKVKELYNSINALLDPATELILGRSCASVGKVSHLLRTSGGTLSEDLCSRFDEAQEEFLDRTLAGDLGAAAHRQASLGVSAGGLGMRRATALRLTASIASRVEARPFVAHLLGQMHVMGLAFPGCLPRFDATLRADIDAFAGQLAPDIALAVRGAVEKATSEAEQRFTAISEGRSVRDRVGAPVGVQHAGSHLVPSYGADDAEHPAAPGTRRLQKTLTRILDKMAAASLVSEAEAEGRSPDVKRLRDLSDDSVNHEYLWLLGEGLDEGLNGEDFLVDIRLRLGASQCDDNPICRVCQRVRVDVQANHAQCCAPGPATVGHNDLRDSVFDLVHLADHTAETEALGLLDTAPSLRPADILTSAVPGASLHALDVTVAAPLAHAAGADPCASAVQRKRARYSAFLDELLADGISYSPMAWTFWGREGDDAAVVLTAVARKAARRRGLPDPWGLLRRARCSIGLALAQRRAAMVRACLGGPAHGRLH